MGMLIAIIGLVSLGLIIGLFILEYQLGKRKKSIGVGLIGPIIYLVLRTILVLLVTDQSNEIMTSIFGAFLISTISIAVYYIKRNSKQKNK